MRGESRARLQWLHGEVRFDENSGSPADRRTERGRLSSAKIEARQRWSKGQQNEAEVFREEDGGGGGGGAIRQE